VKRLGRARRGSRGAGRAAASGGDPGPARLLGDRYEDVRIAAAETLAGPEPPEDLMILTKKIGRLNQSALHEVFNAAKQLLKRHYRRTEPIKQPAVRATMARLTITVLMGKSACPRSKCWTTAGLSR